MAACGLGATADAPADSGGIEPEVGRDPENSVATIATGQLKDPDFRLQAASFSLEGDAVWLSGTHGRYAVAGPTPSEKSGETDWVIGQILDREGDQLLEFRDIAALSAKQAVLLAAGEGAASRIYTTHDRGSTWSLSWKGSEQVTSEPPAKSVFLDCMDFWDAQRGLVFGDTVDDRLYVLGTQDGGETWQRLESTPAARPSEGGFAASGDCLITAREGWGGIVTGAGPQPRIVVTADYGQTWTWHDLPLPNGDTGGAFSLAVDDRDPTGSAWFVAGGDLGAMTGFQANVIASRDQGASWDTLGVLPFEGPVYGLAVDYRNGPGQERVVVVGPGGAAGSVDGGKTFESWLDEAHWSVALGVDGKGWMVGPEARVTGFALVAR